MRAAGIIVVLVALVLLGRSLFALAWDAGTARTLDDWMLIALSALLLAGGGAMIANRAWGWKLALGVVVLLGALIVFGAALSVRNADKASRLALYELPDKRRVATDLTGEWWATPVEKLRELRRENDAIARDWEIQGDAETRLIVLHDPALPTLDGRIFPLSVFLLVNAGHKRAALEVLDGFYSADRDAPVELGLHNDGERRRAIVIARGEKGCVSKTYAIDARTATIVPVENAPSACR